MTDATTGAVTYDASAALILSQDAQKALANAADYIIDSQTMLEYASDDLRKVKALQKEVEVKRTSITGPLNEAVKSVNELFRAPKEYLDKAEATLKRAMVAYTSEQERLAAEARAKAEAQARAERERLAAIEREQMQAAAKAQAEAEAAAKKGDHEAAEKAMAIAQQAEAEAAALQMTQQVMTVTPDVESPTKVSGISSRVTFGAEVNDLLVLIKAVAEGKAPIECIQADMKFLGAQARAFKKAGELFPGVMSIASHSIAARAA